MNKFLLKQIGAYLFTASLLLSFWVCVENCHAEENKTSETSLISSQNIQAENPEKDSCSVQNAPSALFSSQETIVLINSALLPNCLGKSISRQNFQSNCTLQTEKSFVKLPFQILRQLRI